MASLTTLIASEASLVQEAALAVPHSFDKCTHGQGPIRQAVHLCLTCAMPRGLCSACSVACHGDHGETYVKRRHIRLMTQYICLYLRTDRALSKTSVCL